MQNQMTLMCSEWHRALGFLNPRRPVPSRSASLQGNDPRLASVNVNESMLSFLFGVSGLYCSGEKEFRAALVILSALVKTTFTLQLQGTGSFNEVHRKDSLA